MPSKNTILNYKGQDIFVGIDTHLRQWTVTIALTHSIHKTFSMNPKAKELSNYLRRNFPGCNYYSAYEASFCGFSVHFDLLDNGIKNIIVNPADIPTTDKERKQKEDMRDSRKIAKSLRSGDLSGIYIPSKESIEFRGLVRYRKTLVKEISRNKNRIKSLLYFHGIEIPETHSTASKYWSGKFTQWLFSIKLITDSGDEVIKGYVNISIYLRKCLLEVNRSLRARYKQGQYSNALQLLCSVPGIGLITASTFLSEIENINRFSSLDKLCSYIGLIPSTNSSGLKDIDTGITPRSNKPLRNVLIESAWMSVRIDPSMALAFNQLCERMGKNKAIVRIAKKLLNRIRYVLKNNTEYVHAVV